MPQAQDPIKVERALLEVAKSTVASRHVGPKEGDDSLAVLARKAARGSERGSSSSPILIDDDDLFPQPPHRLLCEEITCLQTFGTAGEMDEHAKKDHGTERLLVEDAPKDPEKPKAPPKHYQLKCKKCDFKTFDSRDSRDIEGMVALLRWHVESDHSGEERKGDVFRKVTELVEIEGGFDDRDGNLHQGRYLGFPINYKTAHLNCPRMKKPVYGRLDLLHWGINVLNSTIIEKCHDRGNRYRKY